MQSVNAMDESFQFEFRTLSQLVLVALAIVFMVRSDQLVHAQPPAQLGANEQSSAQQQTQEPDTASTEFETKVRAIENEGVFDSEIAFAILEKMCEIGPRVSATEGMRKQQTFITEHFKAIGAQIGIQRFLVNNPQNNQQVELQNLITRFHPERKKRLLLACHYDTRPFPDQDKKNPQGVFVGANDGASGVGLLSELAKHIAQMDGKYGIDIVFFDGEEFVFDAKRDPMFLGSTFFSNIYAQGKWDKKYEYAILVDMVADKDLQIFYEGNSLDYAPRLAKSLWSVAAEMGKTEFVAKVNHRIRDDHLPLNDIAKIKTCDIIDFDYPNPEAGNIYWHTEQDKPENCSAESMQVVGDVLLHWLRELQKIK